MKNSETTKCTKDLWTAARNSLNRFLRSAETLDIDWRNAKKDHLDYIEARMKEIKSWINGEIKPVEIGPLADARGKALRLCGTLLVILLIVSIEK
ncbi:MAG: hypothetical protein HZC44_10815 [Geobacter sp.]|nr:hypothetical protein [Geobacter sp.]